jgi:hypothetical protein
MTPEAPSPAFTNGDPGKGGSTVVNNRFTTVEDAERLSLPRIIYFRRTRALARARPWAWA